LGLAKKFGSTIWAVHVRFPVTYPVVAPEGIPQVMETAAEQAKQESAQLHQELAGVPHNVVISEGDIWPAINETVQQQKIDLIVMGTRGRTGIGRVLLGSVAEEIFRRTSCPVLTVGPHVSKSAEERLEMKEILYATDFSPASLAALPYATSLAQENQARLTLLHVIGEPKVGELVHPEQYVDSTLRQLRKLVPAEAELWCEPKFMVEQGSPAEKIMEVAATRGADLIVLGVRFPEGSMGAATHLLRPIAHRVVTQAQCPVLTVRG
jgi:nucleotide-binding universal stress UspA family protein